MTLLHRFSLRRPLRLAAVLTLALLLAGCGKIALFSDLAEQEANEMMAILVPRDIDCTKTPAKEGKWNLKVGPKDFPRAVDLLKAHGYPRDKFVRIGDVFQKSGLVSSPTEERIRYMYALSQEIAETLMRIDGVMNARVHIVIPDNDPLAAKVTPSSAAVFIRYRPGFDIESLTPQLKNLVMRSIEGLNYDNVSLVLVPAANAPASAPTVVPAAAPLVSREQLLIGGGVLVLLLLGGAAAWLLQRQSSRKVAKAVPALT